MEWRQLEIDKQDGILGEADDGRVCRILEVVRVDEAQLSETTIHEHRVRPSTTGEEAHARQ
jgi:hypothetical protein